MTIVNDLQVAGASLAAARTIGETVAAAEKIAVAAEAILAAAKAIIAAGIAISDAVEVITVAAKEIMAASKAISLAAKAVYVAEVGWLIGASLGISAFYVYKNKGVFNLFLLPVISNIKPDC